jgi:TP901 family phage tail tape measure protein
MGQFQLKGKDVAHVADLLAGAANASGTDVHQLGEALKQGGSAAHAAGMTIDDTALALVAFSKEALNGSDAGTSLKTMLMFLQSPTDKAREVMERYGLSVYDAQGNMVNVYELAGKLQTAFSGLTQEERNAAFAQIFGNDATRAARALYNQGADGLHRLNAELVAQADAARVAADKTDNLSGDLERLKGSLESVLITAQAGTTGPLRWLADMLNGLVGTFSALPPWVQQLVIVLAAVSGAALLAAVAFLKVRGTVRDVLDAMREGGPITRRFADSIGGVAGAAGKASGALAAIAIVGSIVEASVGDLEPKVASLAVSLFDMANGGKASGEVTRLFGGNLEKLDGVLRNATSGGQGFATFLEKFTGLSAFDGSWTKNIERAKAMDQALAAMVQSGNVKEAAVQFESLKSRAAELGIPIERLINAFPEYRAALEATGGAAGTEAKAAAEATAHNKALAGSLEAAAHEAGGLKTAFDLLNGAALTVRETERNAEAAIDDLAEALEKSSGSMDVHTDAGRNAAAAADNVAKKARDHAQAVYDETHSIEAAKGAYDTYIGQLRQTLIDAGMAVPVVDGLVNAIGRMPPLTQSRVEVEIVTYEILHQDDEREARRVGRRWGGIATHALDGLLSQAGMFPGNRTLYAYAEPETGGEAFVPKNGNYGRSMEILSGAVQWYNASVVPNSVLAGLGGGGESSFNFYLDGQLIDVRVERVVSERDRATARRVTNR